MSLFVHNPVNGRVVEIDGETFERMLATLDEITKCYMSEIYQSVRKTLAELREITVEEEGT